jgi:hypothetical protein
VPTQQVTRAHQPGDLLLGIAVAVFIFGVLVFDLLISAFKPELFSDHSLIITAGSAIAVAAGIAMVRWPRSVFLIFLFACMTVPMLLEETFIPLGFMKLYIQDVVFLFNVCLILCRTSIGKTRFWHSPFNAYVYIYLFLGFVGLVNGLVFKHNEFDEVFGDFRRSFFYFMNYFIALLLVNGPDDLRKIRAVLNIGGVAIILNGLFQLLTGRFYYRRAGDAAHILSHYELTFLSFLLFYSLARLLFDKRASRWRWGGLFAMALVITIVGNYRAAWLGVIGGLFFMFLYLSTQKKLMLTLIAATSALFIATAIAALWEVQIREGRTTLGDEIAAKADVSKTTQDVNVTWRFESYKNAFSLWSDSPLFGTGIGERLEFIAPTSTGGTELSEGHRVHNSMLWVLMTTGAFGFALFAAVQTAYILLIRNYLKRTTCLEGRITVIACGAFYISFMIATAFEIFLESAMPITIFSSSMALCVLTIYFTPGELLPARQ